MTTISEKLNKNRWYTNISNKLKGSQRKSKREVLKKKSSEFPTEMCSNLKTEPVKPENEKKVVQHKRKRERAGHYKKICWSCLNVFDASRKDARTCSSRCRKALSLNGANFNDYGSPAAHFYQKLQLRELEEILNCNYRMLTYWNITIYISWIDLAKDLFSELLPNNDHLLRTGDEIRNFLIEIRPEKETDSVKLVLPPHLFNKWTELVENFKGYIDNETIYLGPLCNR